MPLIRDLWRAVFPLDGTQTNIPGEVPEWVRRLRDLGTGVAPPPGRGGRGGRPPIRPPPPPISPPPPPPTIPPTVRPPPPTIDSTPPPPPTTEPPPSIGGTSTSTPSDLDNDGFLGSVPGIIRQLATGSNLGSGGRLSKGVPVSIARLLTRAGDLASVVSGISDVFGSPSTPSFGGFSTGGTLPSLPGVGTPTTRTAMGVGAGIGTALRGTPPQMCPSGYHYAKDGSGRLVRNRRMNPLNPKAARRAIRRIKAARKMLTSIERSLPTRTVRRRS